ncbi:acyl-CoA thioesterase [Bacteroidales bacterium OttesenSCG-928-K03]|nr:acyl-CoA thioesterase [Bacteroidales bacterium OttesenSCG-928-L14]MDL2242855.1 acyl-CoA thioesterase [Bacteroidales bacterium OttesenSCG-928-K03]
MSFNKLISHRLVKSEDLNHHGTLFAGRCSEWFVESGFIAVTEFLPPASVVCLKLHGMEFLSPIKPGDIIRMESSIVYVGKSTLMTHVSIYNRKSNSLACEGFMTFCHVDENTRPTPHNITITPESEEDIRLWEMAKEIRKRMI